MSKECSIQDILINELITKRTRHANDRGYIGALFPFGFTVVWFPVAWFLVGWVVWSLVTGMFLSSNFKKVMLNACFSQFQSIQPFNAIISMLSPSIFKLLSVPSEQLRSVQSRLKRGLQV